MYIYKPVHSRAGNYRKICESLVVTNIVTENQSLESEYNNEMIVDKAWSRK